MAGKVYPGLGKASVEIRNANGIVYDVDVDNLKSILVNGKAVTFN
jgi:hypothetical protein